MPHLLSPAQEEATTLMDQARAHRWFVRRAINADGRYRLVAAHLTVAQAEALTAQADSNEQRARALLAQEAAKQGEPPFDVVGDHAVVSSAGVPFLVGKVTATGPWGVEIEPSSGTAHQTVAWTGPERTFTFTRPA